MATNSESIQHETTDIKYDDVEQEQTIVDSEAPSTISIVDEQNSIDKQEEQVVVEPINIKNDNVIIENAVCGDLDDANNLPEMEEHQPATIKEVFHFKENDDLDKLFSLCLALAGDHDDTTRSQTTDSVLQLLVTEDMSSIRSQDVLKSLFVNHLHQLPHKVISEVLSVLIAIVKKSVFHLESARGLLIPCINHLLSDKVKFNPATNKDHHHYQTKSNNISSASSLSLTKHFLREWINLLIAHSCDVQELKSILKYSEQDSTLLSFIQQANLRQRNRPTSFFAFPGTKGSMMSLPPFQKWPIQLGWSFSTWFFLEPKLCAQPYLYNFKTGKSGLGYSAHFTGNCLVLTSIRVKGKGLQHCVAYEFPSYKWIHCAITYHNKWRASEIKVYVNGQLSANIEIPWQVQTTEVFDKCFIGGSGTITSGDRSGELNCFCGQMSAVYLFNEGLSPAQICSIHRLGPSYMGQFKYSNESHVNLPPQICKTLYEEKLASSLFCLFTPVAVDSETLCLQLAPFKSSTTVSAHNYFISAPHAALLGQTKAIITQPICSTLQSLGCSRSLLPLLDVFAAKGNSEACSSLIGFLCDLLENSPHWFANEIVQNNGFVMVACALSGDAKHLLSDKLLDIFLNLTRTLLTTSTTVGDSLLLKHLMDNILFNPTLWIYADTKLQIKLYNYLATEFLNGTQHTSNKYTISNSNNSTPSVAYNPTSNAATTMSNHYTSPTNTDDQPKSGYYENSPTIVTELLFGEIRRVSTVLQSLHALKYYYWMVEEKGINPKARNYSSRPSQTDLKTIRSYIALFTKELILRSNTIPLDEIQGLLNYLSSCNHPENLLDVLELLSSLLTEHPASLVSALDQKQGVKVLFVLIGSKSELVRIKALNLLGLFLAQCSHKKKQDIMGPNNLFMLLCDRLRVFKPMTLQVYEALLGILIESDDARNSMSTMSDDFKRNVSNRRIENSAVIKVIATLLHDEKEYRSRCEENKQTSFTQQPVTDKLSEIDGSEDIRRIFINDLWNLIVCSKENRRTILQMSVWQHWLVNMIDSTIDDCQLIRDQVLAIFRVLLYHAIRYEYGGWRVWIDTLAIIHTKVSYDEFCHQIGSGSISPEATTIAKLENSSSSRQQCNPTTTIASTSDKQTGKKKICDSGRKTPQDRQTTRGESNSDITVSDNNLEEPQPLVSSISERIPRESSGIQMSEAIGVDEPDATIEKEEKEESPDHESNDVEQSIDDPKTDRIDVAKPSESLDSIDLAPTRSFRRQSLNDNSDEQQPADHLSQDDGIELGGSEITRQQSLTSIPLDGSNDDSALNLDEKSDQPADTTTTLEEPKIIDTNLNNAGLEQTQTNELPSGVQTSQKAIASPAFRIPEFKWGYILIKLLNDLMFSIECDLYYWRCTAKCNNSDKPPFVPKTATSASNQQSTSSGASSSTGTRFSATGGNSQVESLLQRAENQIYIINIIHFVSQLADNIIIAAGGLLPLLADATGGTRSTPTVASEAAKSSTITCEGLTMSQANALLYRLISMVDVVIFAASHINLTELEADKNTTSGGILRQCLRLACTVTVKNCLVVRALSSRISAMGIGGGFNITVSDFPRDMFDGYQGCSLLSANGLFVSSVLSFKDSDLMASVEYSPHQTPNASSMPSLLPFQSVPIKDANKLLQAIDISRIQACIYHDFSTESRQSQFLALSSLYFISVLMVSKYRDIIEPKQKTNQKSKSNQKENNSTKNQTSSSSSAETKYQNGTSLSNIESNLLNFGKMQPTVSNSQPSSSSSSSSALTDMLTSKLENTLDTVCPILKAIMCDFCAFLSKTLIGSHGQDLVNKEADRTFRRANASPVELVMLLCSQEWQNTLQKNAGLAFIELINEGRVLSHGMKDHIVRVAMEAEFILSRLRADDVAKHEHFSLTCTETQSARLHEEVLINSLISSATRRDYVVYCKFKEIVQIQRRRNFKLDIWEDDDRRKRRFVIDSWDDSAQSLYSLSSLEAPSNKDRAEKHSGAISLDVTETKRILELQQTIEMGGIDNHCSPAAAGNHPANNLDPTSGGHLRGEKDDECDDDDFEVDDDEGQNDSNSADSEAEHQSHGHKSDEKRFKHVENNNNNIKININNNTKDDKLKQGRNIYGSNDKSYSTDHVDAHEHIESEVKNQMWDYDDCSSVNDFTGSVVFAAECSLIWSIYAIPGVFQLTSNELFFEPNQNISDAVDILKRDVVIQATTNHGDQEEDVKSSKSQQLDSFTAASPEQITLRKLDLKALRYCDFLTCNGKILLGDIRAIFSRHYLLQPHALEIFLAQRTSIMFAFSDFDTVKRAVKYLPPVGVGIKYGIPQTRRASLMAPRQLFSASNMMQKWQKREIGNFQYLMFLNTIAGRTYQDLNQYPVFPWILTNYESEELDLNLPSNFRDLSKPVGALNSKRRAEFIERYQSWDNPKVPAFHYGTHYSTAAFTLNWLCRLRGSTNNAYLALQDGKYEEESRLFLSVGDSWVSSLTGGQQNVKELIPEFFYLPEMFHSNLGLPEVEYPPWAKSAEQFVRMHRLALESELVSCQLHQWIDLIFGYKQRGPEAINAVNTFYYLTYQGNVNLNMIQDPSLRDAIETQIKHFGQTPSQLTTEPHPPRFSALHVSPLVFSSTVDEVNKVVKFPFNTSVVHISSCISNYIAATSSGANESITSTSQSLNANNPSSILTITSNNQYQIHKWIPNEQSGHPFTIDPQLEQTGSAEKRRQLVDVDDLCSGISLKLQEYHNGSQANIVDEVQWSCAHYVVTLDGRYIIMGSFYDNSFRVFTTESGKLCQVIYGHRAPITSIARSEGNTSGDFYIATGSQDCSLLLWIWNEKYSQVEGSGVSAVHNPLPKLTISGHLTPVLSVVICSELGLIISGSKNLILVNTTTSGENLVEIDVTLPDILDKNSLESRVYLDENQIQRPQVKDKQKTILEASMLGDRNNLELSSKGNEKSANLTNTTTSSRSHSPNSSVKFSHLKELCCSDYYMTNLQLARELAFIVCVALPPPKRRNKTNDEINIGKSSAAALLMTFNLNGVLMESTTIGHSIYGPRLGDVCALQTTRDGEHLILNDGPTSIKIYRTFNLQPLYGFNINDIPNTLSEDQNRVKSLVLLDNKYALVGLENGKIIIYNADFKNLSSQ